MAEYSRIASGQVLSAGGATQVILPFTPSRIEITNQTSAFSGSGVTKAWWSSVMGQDAAALTTLTAFSFATTPAVSLSANVDSFITSGGFTTMQAALALQYGPVVNISTVTAAAPAVVTTASAHGLVTGDVVVLQNLYQSATTGMAQICGVPFSVNVTSSTSFEVLWDTSQSNFTAYNSATASQQATVKKVLYPALYAPGVAFINDISPGSTTAVICTSPHNFVVGQQVAFRIPQAFGTTQLNSLPNPVIPGSPVYGYVISLQGSTGFTVNINSTGYTAFNSNLPMSSAMYGQTFAQVVAVGDLNTGFGLNAVAPNYPFPQVYAGGSLNPASTIGSPAIAGSYINATYQGFIIGSGIAGNAADVIDWVAYLDDLVI
jgi:hypothetical protein